MNAPALQAFAARNTARAVSEVIIRRFMAGTVNPAALRGPISQTARTALGLDELATLPIAVARERIVVRTRRYAAYQRKWMRRIPGIVLVDGHRPVEEVADAVLDVASAR